MTAPPQCLIASEAAVKKHGLTPTARITGMASAGCAAARHGHRPGAVDAEADGALWLKIGDFDVIELNEASLHRRWLACGNSGFPTTPSTLIRTAAPLRWAIRSACRERGLR